MKVCDYFVIKSFEGASVTPAGSFIMVVMTSEVLAAAEVDAALVLCDEYFTVSMPALFNVFLSHLLRVALVIGP